ncbi:LysR family transcriptional regulator [Luteimonas huabeiensis]|uniref:LysR family transcriptional regulator n=1 Tax=Luteimonas huabeiensis TaxID=1244513 RepID=UPI000466DBC2|nr:LysR family transcriptional regulator [Luteimonas huabeiensis]
MERGPELNLRHLHAAVAVAASGGIGAAAPQVNLSQPALTQAIARLEAQLGQRLFDRQPGGVTPTEAGRLLVPRIERALAYLTRGVRAARRSLRLPALPGLERRVSLSQLRALAAVDAAGNYSLAAARSGVSQPAIYRAVQQLSALIEVPLCVRRGKTVQSTPAAVRMLRFVRLALSELDAGMDELAALRSKDAGRVAIGALPLARAVLLPRVLARFARAHPGATVSVVEGPYAEMLAHLREGGLDLLVGALRDPAPVGDVVQAGLFDDDPVIVGRADHPLLREPGFAFERLLDYPWVIAATGAPVRARWERMFGERGLEPPRLRIECGSVLIIRGLMLEDDWLTLMSRDQFLFERRAGVLREIGVAGPGGRRRIGMTTRADWRPTRLQATFVETFRAVCAEYGAGAGREWPFRHAAPKA